MRIRVQALESRLKKMKSKLSQDISPCQGIYLMAYSRQRFMEK
jgi:hypothetical protein